MISLIFVMSQTGVHSLFAGLGFQQSLVLPMGSAIIVEMNKHPIADAGPDLTGYEGDILMFDGSGSYDPDGSIVSYWWDFDANEDTDGDSNSTNDKDASGPSVSNSYPDNGDFTVTLTVVDDGGGFGRFDLNWLSQELDVTTSIALGDLNKDGNLDYVSGVHGPNRAYLGDGNGSFSLSWTSSETEDETDSIALGDVNGDDLLDILVGNYWIGNTRGINRIYVGDGNGHFLLHWNAQDRIPTRTVALGDFDGDDDLDFVAGTSYENLIYLNDGNGYYALHQRTSEKDDTSSIAVADVDNDNDLDIIFGNGYENRLYKNNGIGDFHLFWNSSSRRITPSIAVADLNGDLFVDFIAGNGGPDEVYVNDGTGQFRLGQELSGSNLTAAVDVSDLDSDGDIDCVAGIVSGQNEIYLNNGLGNLTFFSFSGDVNRTSAISIADLDGDAVPDFLEGNLAESDKAYLARGIPLSDSDTVVVNVFNLPPVADSHGPYQGFEASPIEFTGSHTDPGLLDTHTYDWDFDYDGMTFTIDATGSTVQNTWFDDYSGTVALRVTDDDGGWDIDDATVLVENVAPVADAGDDKEGYEVSTFTFEGSCTDSGKLDTHTYEWDFDYDGITFDIDATGQSVTHTWIDDFDGYVALRVTDDDGGEGIDTAHVLVKNVPPTVELKVLPIEVDVSLRIAGEKWHDVSIELFEDGVLVAEGSLTRYPGSPNGQILDLAHLNVDISKQY
ncbi:MAG: FG-GAP-like repeat-containing protein, partial [Thermoplasmata archaeon]